MPEINICSLHPAYYHVAHQTNERTICKKELDDNDSRLHFLVTD